MPFVEFDSFRAELGTLNQIVGGLEGRTVRDDLLRERFRNLVRTWVSIVSPTISGHLPSTRDFYKLSAEIEKIGRLTSKFKKVAEYRTSLRVAIALANGLALRLPVEVQPSSGIRALELFVKGISDLPSRLVPNPIFGWRSSMEAFVDKYPFDKSVFIMIRYRKRNKEIIKSIKKALTAKDLFGVVASEHNLTDDLYNPVACLLCCSRGIAVFDRPERSEKFNPNVAYELGVLHLLGRRCLILKHWKLESLQSDILMKLYVPFKTTAEIAQLVTDWL